MPIRGRWKRFTRDVVTSLPQKEGAYELANTTKSILYTGSSKNLRRRLSTHLISGKFPTIRYFRCEYISMDNLDSGKDIERKHVKIFVSKHNRRPTRIRRSPRKDPLFDL